MAVIKGQLVKDLEGQDSFYRDKVGGARGTANDTGAPDKPLNGTWWRG